ncbi:MAG TPA: radical SAM protein [Deltaproteobacteria bacterium]|nr:radical SAM protein [Deltaproteobacteria bacterium]
MRIALIAPPYPLEEAPSPPLGLCYVAAACEAAGAQVIILDYIVSRYTPEKLAKALDDFKPDVVGATSVTMNFLQAIHIIRDVKAYNPAIITMMGGPHVSFDAANTFARYPELDLIVIGEAEQTLAELVPAIDAGRRWDNISGIAFQRDGRIITTPWRELISDLDSLPLPARHLLPMSRYHALGFPVSIITSRGCPNKCIFCLGRRMVGFKGRLRDPGLVVDEIEQILDYGFTRINIADDLFTANKARVIALCKEIMRRNVRFTWSAFARVNTVDTEILSIMKEAGCDSISFGIESGNPDILKGVKKGITLDQARNAVLCSKETGLRTHASFMVGLPGESPETLADSRRFAKELDIEHGYHFLSPFPGTTVREEIENYDLEILTDDWNLYDANRAIVSTSQLTPKEMDDFVEAICNEYKAKTDVMEEHYLQGTCTDEEYFLIEGYYRMKLIYSLLSEDLIDDMPILPAGENGSDASLIKSIADVTKMDALFVERTIKSLISSGYIKYKAENGGLKWFWPHNNRTDLSPVS